MSIYEMHLGSWRRDPGNPERWLSYGEIAPQLVEYCRQMGFTHVQLMPVSEHPFTGSWGYQTTGYYAATSRYGTPQDFMHFVDLLHQNDIGVIIDWVPAHFPKDDHGLRQFDGTSLYEHADPRKGEHPGLGHADFQLRPQRSSATSCSPTPCSGSTSTTSTGCASMRSPRCCTSTTAARKASGSRTCIGGRENLEAIDFMKKFNEEVHLQYPGVLTIAEESTAWTGVSRPTYLGGLGFSLKWNMGWMNDTRQYMHKDPIHRKFHQDELTFSLIYAFTENFCLPMSHDEVVHGKGSLLDQMPGDLWQKFANLRLLVRLHVVAPRQEAAVHGRRVRPMARMEPRRVAAMAPAAVAVAPRSAAVPGRPQRAVHAASRRCTKSTSNRPASNGSTATTGRTASWSSSARRRTRRIT